jgi:DNA ligase 1
MKAFAALYRELDETTSSLVKQAALQRYFLNTPAPDAAWAVYFLAGGKPRQSIPTKTLKLLAQQAAGLPQWLFDESYEAVGDLAETIALLLPPPQDEQDFGLGECIETQILPLRTTEAHELPNVVFKQWQHIAISERLVYFKLLTGSFRVGVSRLQVTQALAAISGHDSKRIAQRLMGYTHISARPSGADYVALIAPEQRDEINQRTSGQPFPFFLAHPLAIAIDTFDTVLGSPADWIVEWKWDGIRAQLVKRAGQVWVWSRGEELMTERFPEIASLGVSLPDGTVLDGEIVVWRDGVAQFADLQKRIGRKTVCTSVLKALPVALLVYDVLEFEGQDLRRQSQSARRIVLDQLLQRTIHPALKASELIVSDSWQTLAKIRENSRALGVEGMMLKQKSALYGVGRTKDVGVWWKWKIDPLRIDAVLIYAQRGHGRRASVYSDYTFAVWDGPEVLAGTADRKLVPFAKAYSGLTDAEMAQVDAVIRKTTLESFGPVRSVTPTLIFELGFEGIARSSRHKSGIAVRFPRILRWRQDKPIAEADTLQTLEALLPV